MAALRSPRCPWAWERQWTTSSSQPSPARMGPELVSLVDPGFPDATPKSLWELMVGQASDHMTWAAAICLTLVILIVLPLGPLPSFCFYLCSRTSHPSFLKMKIEHSEVIGFVQCGWLVRVLARLETQPVSCLLATHCSHSVAVCQPHAYFL